MADRSESPQDKSPQDRALGFTERGEAASLDEALGLVSLRVPNIILARRLEDATSRLDNLSAEVNKYYWGHATDQNLLEARNILDIARVITASALFRQETRACHSREDFQDTSRRYEGWTIAKRGKAPYLLPIPKTTIGGDLL